MTKKDNEHFKNSTICWTCDNTYVDDDVKKEIIVILLKIMKGWHIEIVISKLN